MVKDYEDLVIEDFCGLTTETIEKVLAASNRRAPAASDVVKKAYSTAREILTYNQNDSLWNN